jgi:hypothetical protein
MQNPMKKSLLLLLCSAVLVPFLALGADHPAAAAKLLPTVTPSAPKISMPALMDFSRWFQTKQESSSAGCGATFCTQAQKSQCAHSCRHHPFVGLECCFDTCTSFCNCGSVPTGC